MVGSYQGENQSPRRRRRAARRAAGPPTPVAAPPVTAPTAPATQTPTAPIPAAPGPVGAGQHTAAATAHPAPGDQPVHPAGGTVSHGSPGDAPEHQPGPGHGPAVQGAGGTGPTRQRSATRGGASTAGGGESSRRSGRTSREDAAERSLRSLVTTRSTQVSPTAALRAREVALPSADDLAAAEAEVVIVRRHYVPPTELATGRRPDRPNRRGSAE